jgi:predicted transcriptional regulator
MFEEFQQIGKVSTPLTRMMALRTLRNNEPSVFEFLKWKLGANQVPRAITIAEIAWRTNLTYKRARNAKDGLKKKGLIETWTATHRDECKKCSLIKFKGSVV